MNKGTVYVVFDGQAGSCGKGKIAGHVALTRNINLAINNFMSNAGHTFVTNENRKVMTQHLPTSIVNPDVTLCIGPGASITPEILASELYRYRDLLGDRKVHIHPRAMVILEKHRKCERETIRSGSTFKGCGASVAEKIMRSPGVKLFKDSLDDMYTIFLEYGLQMNDVIDVVQTEILVNQAIDNGHNVLVEGSQGCDLDINYGLDYPHTTSRQCNVAQLIADCGISPMANIHPIMVIRPYPIRISSSTNIGIDIDSGGYAESEEISWKEVHDRCGAPDDIEFGEKTTVTKKTRRVFEMNWDRLNYNCMINRPKEIAINFAQYIDWNLVEQGEEWRQSLMWIDIEGKKDIVTIDTVTSDMITKDQEKLRQFLHNLNLRIETPVTMLGYGAKESELVEFNQEEVQ